MPDDCTAPSCGVAEFKFIDSWVSDISGIGNGFVKTTSAISGDYIVGQAYNKGNLVVLSKEDAKDESTGKRR